MPRTSDAKRKTIETAILLFRRQGYHGTGLTQILEESGAPKGSFYFHFPEGKTQLAGAVLATIGPVVCEMIDSAAYTAKSANEFVGEIAGIFYEELERSNYQAGCPVAALANEVSGQSKELALAVSKTLSMWQKSIAKGLEAHSFSKAAALPISGLILNSIEGATMLSKAHKSRVPFDQMQSSLSVLLSKTEQSASFQ